MANDVKEAIDLTYGGSIKSVISEMSNMVLKSDTSGSNNKKVENMWNNCSDDTGDFSKLNNMIKTISRVQVGRSWQEVSLFSVSEC